MGVVRNGLVVVLAAVAAVSGCTDKPAASPKVPSFGTSSPPSSSSRDRPIPRTCAGVVSQTEVSDILQVAVTGQTLPVVGIPEPKINRTARIDCYYGVPDGKDRTAAVVTIFLASYTDEAAARKRMNSTVADERDAGAKPGDVPVGPDKGVLLTGAKRTLIAVRGNNTVVVTVLPDLVAPEQAPSLMGSLADKALTPR